MSYKQQLGFEELGQRELLKIDPWKVVVGILAAAAWVAYCLNNPDADVCKSLPKF